MALADRAEELARADRTPLKGDLAQEWMAY
jgi:hypothetical protein